MTNFLQEFLDKVLYKTSTAKSSEAIPPLYTPKNAYIEKANDKHIGYMPLNADKGVRMQMPNGESITYISKNTNNEKLDF